MPAHASYARTPQRRRVLLPYGEGREERESSPQIFLRHGAGGSGRRVCGCAPYLAGDFPDIFFLLRRRGCRRRDRLSAFRHESASRTCNPICSETLSYALPVVAEGGTLWPAPGDPGSVACMACPEQEGFAASCRRARTVFFMETGRVGGEASARVLHRIESSAACFLSFCRDRSF